MREDRAATAGNPFTLRPSMPNRIAGWGLAAFGVLLAAAGAATSRDDLAGSALMALFGLLFAVAGGSLATAVVRVDHTGIRYRYGLSRHDIARSDIEAIDVGTGSGVGVQRVALFVRRPTKRPVRLTPLQRWATARSKRVLSGTAEQMGRVLGLDPNV